MTSMPNLEPYYSVLRSAGIFASGALVSLGVMSVDDAGTVTTGITHIFNGSKEIMVGVGMLSGPVLTIWGAWAHRPTAVLTAAAALSTTERREAFNSIPDSAKVAITASIPGVEHIVVSPSASSALVAMAVDPDRPKIIGGVG